MSRDRGAVLINALVVVLAIATIATALLVRSESARIRAFDARAGQQQVLNLDAAELLVPGLLAEPARDTIVHQDQAWARGDLTFPLGDGRVDLTFEDLQGRLNVNWLTTDDDYVLGLFRAVFADTGVSQALVADIARFISADGPPTGAYMSRRPPVLPRGGRLRVLEDLRALDGLTEADYKALSDILAALPSDTRLNLNTAPDGIKRAALQPFPPELIAELMAREEPILAMSEIRQRVMELLETEDIDHLPLDRLTIISGWFAVDITATDAARADYRRSIYRVDPATENPVRRDLSWVVFN